MEVEGPVGLVVVHSPPTLEIGIETPAPAQVGKLVVACLTRHNITDTKVLGMT